MKKITLLAGILLAFMLVTISFASAINTNVTNTERKESPLYKFRTRQAISEKLDYIIENIKTRFIGGRLFFVPIKLLKVRIVISDMYYSCTDCTEGTCQRTFQACCTTNQPCTSKTCNQR